MNLPLATCQDGKCSCSGLSIKQGQNCVCDKGMTLNKAEDGCMPGESMLKLSVAIQVACSSNIHVLFINKTYAGI